MIICSCVDSLSGSSFGSDVSHKRKIFGVKLVKGKSLWKHVFLVYSSSGCWWSCWWWSWWQIHGQIRKMNENLSSHLPIWHQGRRKSRRQEDAEAGKLHFYELSNERETLSTDWHFLSILNDFLDSERLHPTRPHALNLWRSQSMLKGFHFSPRGFLFQAKFKREPWNFEWPAQKEDESSLIKCTQLHSISH